MCLTTKQKKLLAGSFLFEGLEALALAPFLEGLEAIAFQPGEDIYTADSFRRSIGILTKGTVRAYKPSGVVLNTLGPGECFGVAALFRPVTEYVATVRAKTSAEVVFITDEQLAALFGVFPRAAINYISFLSGRIDFLNRKIDSFTTPTTAAGLSLHLLEHGSGGSVTVSGGYSDLARRLNMGRASLYRSLDQLEQQGVIRREEKTIHILKPDALRSFQ